MINKKHQNTLFKAIKNKLLDNKNKYLPFKKVILDIISFFSKFDYSVNPMDYNGKSPCE
jgi:uncharacterized protein YccT (UPF0319 family)